MTEVDLIAGVEPNTVTSEVDVYVHESEVHPMLLLELSEDVTTGSTMRTFSGEYLIFLSTKPFRVRNDPPRQVFFFRFRRAAV